MSETPDPELFDKIVNLSKRRGIVFQSAEIYGGVVAFDGADAS